MIKGNLRRSRRIPGPAYRRCGPGGGPDCTVLRLAASLSSMGLPGPGTPGLGTERRRTVRLDRIGLGPTLGRHVSPGAACESEYGGAARRGRETSGKRRQEGALTSVGYAALPRIDASRSRAQVTWRWRPQLTLKVQ
eukprot:766752-Hanusia_phi.AAC.7